MIKIVAKISVKPECKEEFLKVAATLVEASQAEEGNIAYNLHEDIANPNSLAFIEIWKDQAAIDFHNQTEHFISAGEKFGSLCAAPMDIALYKVLI